LLPADVRVEERQVLEERLTVRNPFR